MLSVYLFVPLLMKVTQEDVCFFCYNNCGENMFIHIIYQLNIKWYLHDLTAKENIVNGSKNESIKYDG